MKEEGRFRFRCTVLRQFFKAQSEAVLQGAAAAETNSFDPYRCSIKGVVGIWARGALKSAAFLLYLSLFISCLERKERRMVSPFPPSPLEFPSSAPLTFPFYSAHSPLEL